MNSIFKKFSMFLALLLLAASAAKPLHADFCATLMDQAGSALDERKASSMAENRQAFEEAAKVLTSVEAKSLADARIALGPYYGFIPDFDFAQDSGYQRELISLGMAANKLRQAGFQGPKLEKALSAVQAAHIFGAGEVGRDGTLAQLGNYTNRQIAEKSAIMEAAGISHELRKYFLDEGIAGEDSIDSYGANLSDAARDAEPIIGRDQDIAWAGTVLASKAAERGNLWLKGPVGVGKKSIAIELARKANKSEINIGPNPQVYELRIGELANISNNAEQFKEKMNAFIKDVKTRNPKGTNVIVIENIDEAFADEQNKSKANEGILALANAVRKSGGNLKVIVTSTSRSASSLGTSVSQLFMERNITPLTEAVVMDALKKERDVLQASKKPRLIISDRVLSEVYRMSDKFKMGDMTTIEFAMTNLRQIAEHSTQKNIAKADLQPGDATKLEGLSQELAAKAKILRTAEKGSNQETSIKGRMQQILDEMETIEAQRAGTVASVEISLDDVKEWLGIVTEKDIGKIEGDTKKAVTEFATNYSKEVIGQPHVGIAIQNRVRLYYANRRLKAGRPIALMILPGKPGVGKTFTAEVTQRLLAPTTDQVIQLNMGDFQSSWDVANIRGATKGTIGFDKETPLHKAAKFKGPWVLNLDEISRGNEAAIQIFLDAFERGHMYLTDGVRVDFSNAIVFMTTNVASDQISEQQKAAGKAGLADADFVEAVLKPALKAGGVSEAMLSRVGNDGIVAMAELSKDELRQLVDVNLKGVKKIFSDEGMKFSVTDEVKDFLVEHKLDPAQGPRQLTQNIENLILAKATEADFELSEQEKRGNELSLVIEDRNGKPTLIGKVLKPDGTVVGKEWVIPLDDSRSKAAAAKATAQNLSEEESTFVNGFDVALQEYESGVSRRSVDEKNSFTWHMKHGAVPSEFKINPLLNQESIDKLSALASRPDLSDSQRLRVVQRLNAVYTYAEEMAELERVRAGKSLKSAELISALKKANNGLYVALAGQPISPETKQNLLEQLRVLRTQDLQSMQPAELTDAIDSLAKASELVEGFADEPVLQLALQRTWANLQERISALPAQTDVALDVLAQWSNGLNPEVGKIMVGQMIQLSNSSKQAGFQFYKDNAAVRLSHLELENLLADLKSSSPVKQAKGVRQITAVFRFINRQAANSSGNTQDVQAMLDNFQLMREAEQKARDQKP